MPGSDLQHQLEGAMRELDQLPAMHTRLLTTYKTLGFTRGRRIVAAAAS